MIRKAMSTATNQRFSKNRRWTTSNVSPLVRTSAVKCSTQKCRINNTSRAAPVTRCRNQLNARGDISGAEDAVDEHRDGPGEEEDQPEPDCEVPEHLPLPR